MIARYRSYHGATAGAITLTGDPRRWPAEPGMPGVVRMFDPYTYRCPAGHPDPCPVCTRRRRTSRRSSSTRAPHTVAAVILETRDRDERVIVPPDGYLQSIREVCDRHGILLICDEVMAGFGRTGSWFACEHWNVVPDILTVAKGINSGYVPLGAMVISRARRATGSRTSSSPAGSRTADHPLACASGGRVDRGVPRGGHRRERGRDGRVPRGRLRALAERHPSIGDVRGLGCFWGLELVRNRETREPLVPFNAGGEAAAPVSG